MKKRLLIVSYIDFFSSRYMGGGWIGSFLRAVSQTDNYDLGVIYLTENKSAERHEDGISYFPLCKPFTFVDKFNEIVLHRPRLISDRKWVDGVIDRFKPDVILLFGIETETGALVVHVKDIPVIVHIQGILSACVDNWFPKLVNHNALEKYLPLRMRLLRHTPMDYYKIACKRAEIERKDFRIYEYYLGRTEWDRSCCLKFSPAAKYFHCDELIREEFRHAEWRGYAEGGKIVISSVCNGEIYKGYDNVLRCASVLKCRGIDFEWNVYGVKADNVMIPVFEGELKDSFASSNVYFRGPKNAAQLAEYLSTSTVFVHPSHIDNSSNALCEAMMVGVPVVAMNVGGNSSMLSDGGEGFIVDDYDCDGLADRICMIAGDSILARRLSSAARKRAVERHSADGIAKQLEVAITEVLK